MEETKKKIWEWVEVHKGQLILAGISITAIIGVILGLKKKDALMELWDALEESIKDTIKTGYSEIPIAQDSTLALEIVTASRTYTPPQDPFEVVTHIRELPAGWHHSAEKAAEAAAMGIDLLENQTIVDHYMKNAVA